MIFFVYCVLFDSRCRVSYDDVGFSFCSFLPIAGYKIFKKCFKFNCLVFQSVVFLVLSKNCYVLHPKTPGIL